MSIENSIELWKSIKQKKQKIIVSSYLNSALNDFMDKQNLNLVRFDIDEVSKFYGYANSYKISLKEMKFLLNKKRMSSSLFALDIPIVDIYENGNELSNILNIIKEYEIDFISLNVDYNVLNLSKKLYNLGIPTIIYFNNNQKNNHNIEYISENLIEAGNTSAYLIITENIETTLYEKLKSSCKIPVLSNKIIKNSDGYYIKYSEIIGLTTSGNNFLNINDLINGAFKDLFNEVNFSNEK